MPSGIKTGALQPLYIAAASWKILEGGQDSANDFTNIEEIGVPVGGRVGIYVAHVSLAPSAALAAPAAVTFYDAAHATPSTAKGELGTVTCVGALAGDTVTINSGLGGAAEGIPASVVFEFGTSLTTPGTPSAPRFLVALGADDDADAANLRAAIEAAKGQSPFPVHSSVAANVVTVASALYHNWTGGTLVTSSNGTRLAVTAAAGANPGVIRAQVAIEAGAGPYGAVETFFPNGCIISTGTNLPATVYWSGSGGAGASRLTMRGRFANAL